MGLRLAVRLSAAVVDPADAPAARCVGGCGSIAGQRLELGIAISAALLVGR